MMKRLTAAAILALLAGSASAQNLMGDRTAQQIVTAFEENSGTASTFEMPTLNIGDEPPAFKIDSWIKGAPISSFEEGNVYLIDFWATWCGPCIAIMPHLTELQSEHADEGLTVVGVSIWENGKDESGQRVALRGEKQAEHVQKFVDKNDDKMGYTVATGSESFETEWMGAAAQNGIPTVMIVDRKGKIGWIGYGTDTSLDQHLNAILADTHDYKASHEQRIEDMKAEWKQMNGPDYVAHFEELAETDRAEAGAFAQAISETVVSDNPMALNAIAWMMVENEGWSPESVKLAEKIATQACELTDWKSAMVLDTLAWAQFRAGDAEAAIETEKKAIEALKPDEVQYKADFERALETFGG